MSFEWLADVPSQATGFNATSINGHGDYAGNYFVPRAFFGDKPFAYTYVDGTINTLIGGENSAVVSGINDAGQVAGYFNTTSERRGSSGGPTSVVPLDLGQRTYIFDINNTGTTVGAARNNLGDDFVFRNNGDQFADFFSNYLVINDFSVVAGINQSINPHSIFVDQNGQTTQLGLPSADSTFATVEDINDTNNIVGFSLPSLGDATAYVYDPATGFRDLPTLSVHTAGIARGVDNAGRVVGESFSSNDNRQAVVWVDDQPFSLNHIVGEATDGGTLIAANDIAENGWVVGIGEYQGIASFPWRAEISFGVNRLRWIDPAGGLFSDDDNWESGAAPESGDNIVFDIVNGGYVVDMDTNAEVSSLTVDQGTVSLRSIGNAGSTMGVSNTLTVGTVQSVRAGLDVIGGIMNADNVNIGTTADSDALVTLRDNATLDPTGNVTVGGGTNAKAQLFVISGSTLQLDEGENLTVTGAESKLTADAPSIGTTNLGGGVMTVNQGAELTVNGDLDILDSDLFIQNRDTVVTVVGSSQFTPGSRVRISDGGKLLPETVTDAGTVLINTTGLTEQDAGVEVTGAGSWLRVGDKDIAIGTVNNGEVEVSNGGELITLADLVLGGIGNNSFGDLVVTGEGSNVLANQLFVNTSGEDLSVFEVEQGGKANIFENVVIDNSEVILTGAGSEIEVGSQFRITGGANATLDVSDGGRLLVNTDLNNPADEPVSLIFDSLDPLFLGNEEVLVGGTTVKTGGEVRTIGDVYIGDASDGLLAIVDSGLFLALGRMWIGDGENDTKGFLVVDGTTEFLADVLIVGSDEGGEGQFLCATAGARASSPSSTCDAPAR